MIALLPGAVKGDPILTVAPAEIYAGESLYIGLENTTANSTFVLYILQRQGHVVYEYENVTDEDGEWAGLIVIVTDETGYPDLEFGDHTVQVMVNRSMANKHFNIVYDDNYRWNVDQENREATEHFVKTTVGGVVTTLIIIVALLLTLVIWMAVGILYLVLRTPKWLVRGIQMVKVKLVRWSMGRKFPEVRANLDRDKMGMAFHEKKALLWEAQIIMNDNDRLLHLVSRKYDRFEEIYSHFKGKLTKKKYLQVLSRMLEIWRKSKRFRRAKAEVRGKLKGHTPTSKLKATKEIVKDGDANA